MKVKKYKGLYKLFAAVFSILTVIPGFTASGAEESNVFEDEMKDLTLVYDSEGAFLVKNDLDWPEDMYRIYKAAVDKQSITYKMDAPITGYEIKTYSTQQNIDKIVDIYLSNDEENWDKSEFVFETETGHTNNWNWSFITQKKKINGEYHYLKIVMGDGKNTWNPQISDVALFMNGLTARPYAAEPEEPSATQSFAEYSRQEAAALVFGSGILEEKNSDIDMPVTRGEFARALLELNGISTDYLPASSDGSLRDVPESAEYANAAYMAVLCGIMETYADGTFEIDNPITGVQAARGCMRALGYVFNTDYIAEAHRIGLLDGLAVTDLQKELTREQSVILLYNALNIPPVVVSGDSLKKDNTAILEGQKNISKRKGQITAVYGGSLNGTSMPEDECVEIEGVLYRTRDKSINNFLGRGVQYYVNEDDEILAYNLLEKGAEPLTIFWRDMATEKKDYEQGRLVYNPGDGKNKTVKINFDFMAFNNFYTGISYEMLTKPDSYITLYDSDEDNIYDTAMIERYSYIVVKSVNAEKGIIQGIYGEVLDMEEFEEISLYKAGEKTDASQLKAGNTISLLISPDGEYARGYIRTAKIKGKISKISEEKLTIGESEYTAADSYRELYESGKAQRPAIAVEGTFYLGRNYEIIGFTANTLIEQYAYMYKGGCDDSDAVWLKLFTDDERFLSYEGQEIRVKNGGRTETVTAGDFDRIFCNGGAFEEGVVKLDFNEDGSPKYIDLDVSMDAEIKTGSFNGTSILCGAYPITPNTKVFSIPTDRKKYDNYSTNLSLAEGDTIPNSSDMKYHMRFYKLNDMNSPEVLVVYQSDENDSRQIVINKSAAVVNDIKEVYDDEESEVKTKVYLGADGEEAGYDVSEQVRLENMQPGQEDFRALKRGDIILYATNGQGSLVRIFVLYHSDGKLFLGGDGLTKEYCENVSINPDYPILYGEIKNFGSGFLVAETAGKTVAASVSANTKYYIINTKDKEIERPAAADIRFGDKVIIKTMRFNATEVFIIRD
ncbi:MAG: S-layer homology domain-containing protein [Clostridia bacterium]|nr:S-layer homology domain-containing protein [Clostridia bacterium]